MSQLIGADVSKYQGIVDWPRMKNEGASFGFARAGYGGGGVDETFARNWREIKEAGLVRLAYFFAYPGRSSGVRQANDFLNIIGGLQPGDGLMLDMEDEVAYGRMLVQSDVNWAKDFLDECQRLTRVKPLIYLNTSLKARLDWSIVVNADYGLHHANYGSNNGKPNTEPNPAPWKFNAFWQYTSNANFGGENPVDMNIFNGTMEQLLKYCAPGTVTIAPSKPAPVQPVIPSANGRYVVKAGDALSAIAPKFSTTWQALASLNNIPNPDKIYVGQVLVVPNSSPTTYVVKQGDALSRVFPNNWREIARINGLANPDRIYPGQVLRTQ